MDTDQKYIPRHLNPYAADAGPTAIPDSTGFGELRPAPDDDFTDQKYIPQHLNPFSKGYVEPESAAPPAALPGEVTPIKAARLPGTAPAEALPTVTVSGVNNSPTAPQPSRSFLGNVAAGLGMGDASLGDFAKHVGFGGLRSITFPTDLAQAVANGLGLSDETRALASQGVLGLPGLALGVPGFDKSASLVKDVTGLDEATGDPFVRRIGQEIGGAVLPGGLLAKPALANAVKVGLMAGLGRQAGAALGGDNSAAEAVGGVLGAFGPSTVTGLFGATDDVARRATDIAPTLPSPAIKPDSAGGNPLMSAIETTSVGGRSRLSRSLISARDKLFEYKAQMADRLSSERGAEAIGAAMRNDIETGRIPEFKARASDLYDAAESQLPQGATITPRHLSAELNEIAGVVEGAEGLAAFLNPVRKRAAQLGRSGDEAIDAAMRDANSAIPVQSFRTVMTDIGSKLSGAPSLGNITQGQYKRLYSAAKKDMDEFADTLPEFGDAFKRANKFYADGIATVEEVYQPLLRKVDDALGRNILNNKEAPEKLLRLKNSVSPEAWRPVEATQIDRLGRGAGSHAEHFSFAKFGTMYSKLSEDVKSVLFSAQTREDLDFLATLSGRVTESERVFANPSGTAQALGQMVRGGAVLAAVGSGNATPIVGVFLAETVGPAVATLMTSPTGRALIKRLAADTSQGAMQATMLQVARNGAVVSALGSDVLQDLSAAIDQADIN